MRVVLGVDGTPGSEAATRWVAEHGAVLDAEVAAVHVIPRIELWGIAALQVDFDSVVESRRSQLRGPWTEPLRSAGLKVSPQLMRGDPGTQLCARAEALEADLLVIGTKYHTALHDLLGGTAHKIVNHSRTAVVVIPVAMAARRSRPDRAGLAPSRLGFPSRPHVWRSDAIRSRKGGMRASKSGSA